MAWKENKRVYNRRYNKNAYKQIVVLIRKDDTQMLNHLSKQESVNPYIRELIKKDMKSDQMPVYDGYESNTPKLNDEGIDDLPFY